MKAATALETTGYDPVRLIEDHQAGIWRYLRALGCDTALADDLTQETFLAVLQRPFHDYNQAATSAYLRRTAYNLFITTQRRSGRCLVVEDVERLDQTWARWAGRDNGEELLDALRRCLEGLSDRARLALQMRFRERESRANIAERLQITEHGAKNLMQRAKHKLRDCIESKLE